MTVSQISVFTESKPGHLARNLRLLEDAHVNVRGYSVSDTGDYGIARFIVDDPDAGAFALKDAGCALTVTQVLCLKLVDEPGELARIMEILAKHHVNVTYSYSMISTYIIIASDDTEATKAALEGESVEMIDQKTLANDQVVFND